MTATRLARPRSPENLEQSTDIRVVRDHGARIAPTRWPRGASRDRIDPIGTLEPAASRDRDDGPATHPGQPLITETAPQRRAVDRPYVACASAR
jgi:hypothetical protein